MKHRTFFTRVINLAIILALILIYNNIIHDRIVADAEAKAAVREEEERLLAEAYAEAGMSEDEIVQPGFKDGTYEGSSQGYGGQIVVSVTVSGGEIAAIDIISAAGEDAAYLNMSKPMLDEIVATQDLEVDTVTGATLSSVGMRNAVILALQQAV